jgi:hypothetical protein
MRPRDGNFCSEVKRGVFEGQDLSSSYHVIAEFMRVITGWDITLDELLAAGEKIGESYLKTFYLHFINGENRYR